MKSKLIFLSLLYLLLSVNSHCFAYDFSAVSNGDTLYYYIINEDSVCVGTPISNPYSATYSWGDHVKPSGKLIIPSTVSYNGVEYIVAYVKAYAFRNCSDIDTVIISDGISAIHFDAFTQCSSLKMVELPTSLNYIGVRAFAFCSNLRTIIYNPVAADAEDNGMTNYRTFDYSPIDTIVLGPQVQTVERVLFRNRSPHVIVSYNPIPPTPIGDGAFITFSGSDISVKIPCGALNAYANHNYWSDYSYCTTQMCDGLTIAEALSNSDTMGLVQGSGVYPYGDTATFTAIPRHGFGLASWSDGCTDNPRQIRMESDTSITATFVPVSGIVHDTVLLPDTISFIDTIIYNDTLYFFDTTSVYLYDTISVYDSITIFDTVALFDTIWVYDTIMVYDTITFYDTVYVSIDEIDVNSCNWYVFAEGEFITVRGACGETVQVFDALGRRLHIQQNVPDAVRFHMPSSSTYLIRVGNWPARKVTLIK